MVLVLVSAVALHAELIMVVHHFWFIQTKILKTMSDSSHVQCVCVCVLYSGAVRKGHCMKIYGITATHTTQGKLRLLKITRKKKSHKNLRISLTATGEKTCSVYLSLSSIVGRLSTLLSIKYLDDFPSPFRSTNFGMFPLIRAQHHWR